MKSRKENDNTLSTEVEENRWNKRYVQFQQMSSKDLLDFPELTNKDLKILFSGTYQLKQAISYLAEMLDKNNDLNVK